MSIKDKIVQPETRRGADMTPLRDDDIRGACRLMDQMKREQDEMDQQARYEAQDEAERVALEAEEEEA